MDFIEDEHPNHPGVAGYLLSMRLPPADEERVNELSAKARAGSLVESEAKELDSYVHIGHAVIQSRARYQSIGRAVFVRRNGHMGNTQIPID